jgi:hypothetical protein
MQTPDTVAQLEREIEALRTKWSRLFPYNDMPNEPQFRLWLVQYGHAHVHYAIGEAGRRFCRVGWMNSEHLARFVSAVSRRSYEQQ